ncbi:MAG: site-2 protease family protein [Candidatus Rokubacteria bacterium]|nr:site-2 protease family protein [Candidatus Rokubacteria bacterium]
MSGAVTLFRVWGIPVRVHVSWLVIFGLIAWSLSVGYFPRVLPDLPLVAYWANGLLAALLLFVSVFLHELSHSVAARRYGIPVSGITLHVFGGVSQLEREPGRPGVEAVVAIVGPLTSLMIAAVVAAADALWAPPPAAAAVMRYLVLVNVVVGVFNLVPGFPLDGGRLLRAVLWKWKGNLRWATQMASRVGSAVAFLLMGLGIVRALAGEFLGGLWFVLIGVFLRQAAEGSYQQLVVRRALAPLAVRDVMTREVVHVPPGLSVAQVVHDFFWQHHVSSFPVLDGPQVVGILSIHQLKALPQERWAETPVREIMLPVTEPLIAAPGDRLWQAFEKLSQNGLGRLAVVENGALVGYLSLKDVLHILAVSAAGSRGRPGGAP